MPEETETKEPMSLDATAKKWQRAAERALMKEPYLATPAAAKRLVEEAADRIVPLPDGSCRAMKPGDRVSFFDVHDTGEPLAEFVAFLATGLTDEDHPSAVALREKRIAELSEEKAASGTYRM